MRRALAVIVAMIATGCGAVHAAGTCDDATLRLASVDGRIRARFALPDGVPWRLVVVHEGHVVWRGHAGPRGERWLADYDGSDHVSVRAAGPGGGICTASADLAERN
jgi:hypothetical protein